MLHTEPVIRLTAVTYLYLQTSTLDRALLVQKHHISSIWLCHSTNNKFLACCIHAISTSLMLRCHSACFSHGNIQKYCVAQTKFLIMKYQNCPLISQTVTFSLLHLQVCSKYKPSSEARSFICLSKLSLHKTEEVLKATILTAAKHL